METRTAFLQELAWTRTHMPRTRRALAALPDLTGVRLACSIHIDLKMVPLLEGVQQKGAQLFVITCNPQTARDEVVAHVQSTGVTVDAWHGMPADAYQAAITHALAWQPTHLCEMGADLTMALHQQPAPAGAVRAGLEATGSGIARLAGLNLRYPIFNWDDLPVKEGLHNRRMVGLTTWHMFLTRTWLTLHGKRVLVVGYGSVGRGLADAARAYGGIVCVAERSPARALEAQYAGWEVRPLEDAIFQSDVIVTATGARGVIHAEHLPLLKNGVFLLNVGHHADEIDVAALYAYPHRSVMPFIEAIDLGERTVYLLAGGSMANLTAGQGDSLNAFDVTLAVMTSGIGHIVGEGTRAPAGVHILPRAVWESMGAP
jgi:adenosylhomocysteinase